MRAIVRTIRTHLWYTFEEEIQQELNSGWHLKNTFAVNDVKNGKPCVYYIAILTKDFFA